MAQIVLPSVVFEIKEESTNYVMCTPRFNGSYEFDDRRGTTVLEQMLEKGYELCAVLPDDTHIFRRRS